MAETAILQKGPTKGMTPWQHRSRVTDAVLASFSLQSKENPLPDRIPAQKVFGAFCKLKDEYPYWLGSLHFDKGADTYISKGLEDVLFALGAFGLVTVENHDFRYLRADPDTRDMIGKQLEDRLSSDHPDELETLRRLANEFRDIVKE